MNPEVSESVFQLLETISEGLAVLQTREDPNLQQDISAARARVTQALEAAMGCSLEDRICVSSLSDEDWLRTALRIMEEILNPFQPLNQYDREFLNLLDAVWKSSKQTLVQAMKANMEQLRRSSEPTYAGFVEYFARFPLWGSLNPDAGDYQTLELRAAVLKEHSYDFLWLYCRLEDYLSRRTLTAILFNWLSLNTQYLDTIRSIFPDYWEPDIFPDNRGDVMVDLGAFNGDSIQSYVRFYGDGYRKIYAYEISAGNAAMLRRNMSKLGFHDVEIRQKGAGRESGWMFVQPNADPSANRLSDTGGGQRAQIVALDDDLEETPTLIKMDIEGAEQSALLGSQRIIREHHPKLAVCVYHGYEDLWKIPVLIDTMYPDYQFFLRHNGGNLIPTEFTLLCKP